MDKGTELYKKLIDEFVEMSRSCVSSESVRNGNVAWDRTNNGINSLLPKLTQNDRNILADYILKSYFDGIFDVLDLLEWYACCRNMKITIDGETLPTDKFEGIQNDFIGRCDDWEWSKD